MCRFIELIPGSPWARRAGCTCLLQSEGRALKADPACPIHGVAIFRCMVQTAEGRSTIDRFRQNLEVAILLTEAPAMNSSAPNHR